MCFFAKPVADPKKGITIVLILIVVDVLLCHNKKTKKISCTSSLNPYCSGCASLPA